MLYAIVNTFFYEGYLHELALYSRQSEDECKKHFFKDAGVKQLYYHNSTTEFPPLPAGNQYVSIPNGGGYCIHYNLESA